MNRGYSSHVGAVGTSIQAFLAVGMVQTNSKARGLPKDCLVGVPLEQKPLSIFNRKFYALVVEAGSLRPYELDITSAYFFSELRSAEVLKVTQGRRWRRIVDTAVEKELRTRAERGQNDRVFRDITPARLAHMQQTISDLKERTCSTSFRELASWANQGLPTYFEAKKQPVDLNKMDTKLKNNGYNNVAEYVRDFKLMITNCYSINGWDHMYSRQGAIMDSAFNLHMESLPNQDTAESVPGDAAETSKKTTSQSSKLSSSFHVVNEIGATLPSTTDSIEVENSQEPPVTISRNQNSGQQEMQGPSRKRQRTKSGGSSAENELKKSMEAFANAEEQHSTDLLRIVKSVANPRTLKAMNEMYEHSFVADDTRAKAAFA